MWSSFVLFIIAEFVSGVRIGGPGPQINIYRGNEQRCSGIIISRHEIIAPAQCVQDWKKSKLKVRSLTSKYIIEHNHEIIGAYFHNGFEIQGEKVVNDIAVLRVSGSLGERDRYASLVEKGIKVEADMFGTIFGFDSAIANFEEWGSTEAYVITENQSVCENYIQGVLAPDQFCATTLMLEIEPQLCPGDTGMPLIANYSVIGFASYWIGIGNGNCSTRAVYTNIAYHRDFIDQSLQRFEEIAERGELKNPPGLGNPVVSLERRGTDFICAGVLISDREVITSAGCARRNRVGDWRLTMIRAGSETAMQGGQLRKEIRRCYCDEHHLGLNSRRKTYDIAVMRVDQPFDLTGDVSAINIFEKGEVVNSSMSGVLSFYYNHSSLEQEKIQVVDTDACKQNYSSSSYGTIADDHMCAGPSKLCENDNGGPLFIDNRLAGIATFGVESCDPQRNPDVFTEIAKVRGEIDGCLNWFKQLESEGILDQYGDYRGWFEKLVESIF